MRRSGARVGTTGSMDLPGFARQDGGERNILSQSWSSLAISVNRAFCHPPYSVEAGGGRATAPVYLYTSLQHGISALVLTGAHNPFSVKTKRKEVLTGVRGCVMHTGLSELFLFMCRSASASSRSA